MRKAIIIEAVLGAIAGAATAYTYCNIRGLQKRIKQTNKELSNWIKDLAENCTNTCTIDDLEGDKKDPIDPTVIYVYD